MRCQKTNNIICNALKDDEGQIVVLGETCL